MSVKKSIDDNRIVIESMLDSIQSLEKSINDSRLALEDNSSILLNTLEDNGIKISECNDKIGKNLGVSEDLYEQLTNLNKLQESIQILLLIQYRICGL